MRVIIVHTLQHARAALECAFHSQVAVALQSAPDAIFYGGNLYLWNLFTQARQDYPQIDAIFILDCADAGAETIAAIQLGHRHIRSSAPPALKAKLADIAAQYGAQMMDDEYESLDLLHVRDAAAACHQFLSQ